MDTISPESSRAAEIYERGAKKYEGALREMAEGASLNRCNSENEKHCWSSWTSWLDEEVATWRLKRYCYQCEKREWV